jgi:hypothetical protein
MPVGYLKDAWKTGNVSRVTIVLGLIVSTAWATFVIVVALRLMIGAIQWPALPPAFKVLFSVLTVLVVVFLVIPLPAQWMMYTLQRLDERRRKAGWPKS